MTGKRPANDRLHFLEKLFRAELALPAVGAAIVLADAGGNEVPPARRAKQQAAGHKHPVVDRGQKRLWVVGCGLMWVIVGVWM